jgi:hypothetical protein
MDTDSKLDKILDKLGEHSETLAKHGVIHEQNAKELAYHIKRTDVLQNEVHSLWKWKWMVSGGIIVVTFILQLLIKKI